MTQPLYRDDAYRTEAQAIVTGVHERGYILDATIFYPQGGGQPGDKGMLVAADGREVAVTTTVYAEDRQQIIHVPEEGAAKLAEGDMVTLRLDWETRLPRMRIHTALHLLSVVLPYPVTGGAIGDGTGRLDFDIQDARSRQGRNSREAQRLDRARRAHLRIMDHRRGTRRESRPGQDDVG